MATILLYPISLIPLRILYLISDVFAYLLYHVFKYRREVVKANIDRSFPHLNETEKKDIEKRFYRNFCDHFIETLKLLTMSEKQLDQHIEADYLELEKILSNNQNCHIYLGHQFNWEWANAHVSMALKEHNIIVAYKPLSSKSFNNLMLRIRSRFGSKMVSSQNMKKEMEPYINRQHVLVLVADQNPLVPKKSFWTSFLSQRTAFISGTELYTAASKTPILFAEIIRQDRGKYKFALTPVFDFTEQYQMGLITTIFTEKLENTIKDHPENYLWSHKRWKHIYKKEYDKRFFDRSMLLAIKISS